MKLEILPTRIAGAAENMANDFLLLQRYPEAHASAPRFRHYEWRAPAFTFGYSQKIAFVSAQIAVIAGEQRIDLCRRPTGGGIVDHREDWTYALVIPRGHPLEELRATQSYRAVHEALAEALRAQGVDAVTKLAVEEPPEGGTTNEQPGVCFRRAEIYDVVQRATGAKIAGAAQKRNKHGLLFQGSIGRPAAMAAGDGRTLDWDRFEEDFVAGLAVVLSVSAETTPWPELNEDEVSGLTDQYSSPEWIGYR